MKRIKPILLFFTAIFTGFNTNAYGSSPHQALFDMLLEQKERQLSYIKQYFALEHRFEMELIEYLRLVVRAQEEESDHFVCVIPNEPDQFIPKSLVVSRELIDRVLMADANYLVSALKQYFIEGYIVPGSNTTFQFRDSIGDADDRLFDEIHDRFGSPVYVLRRLGYYLEKGYLKYDHRARTIAVTELSDGVQSDVSYAQLRAWHSMRGYMVAAFIATTIWKQEVTNQDGRVRRLKREQSQKTSRANRRNKRMSTNKAHLRTRAYTMQDIINRRSISRTFSDVNGTRTPQHILSEFGRNRLFVELVYNLDISESCSDFADFSHYFECGVFNAMTGFIKSQSVQVLHDSVFSRFLYRFVRNTPARDQYVTSTFTRMLSEFVMQSRYSENYISDHPHYTSSRERQVARAKIQSEMRKQRQQVHSAFDVVCEFLSFRLKESVGEECISGDGDDGEIVASEILLNVQDLESLIVEMKARINPDGESYPGFGKRFWSKLRHRFNIEYINEAGEIKASRRGNHAGRNRSRRGKRDRTNSSSQHHKPFSALINDFIKAVRVKETEVTRPLIVDEGRVLPDLLPAATAVPQKQFRERAEQSILRLERKRRNRFCEVEFDGEADGEGDEAKPYSNPYLLGNLRLFQGLLLELPSELRGPFTSEVRHLL